jgi:hypothetical protein
MISRLSIAFLVLYAIHGVAQTTEPAATQFAAEGTSTIETFTAHSNNVTTSSSGFKFNRDGRRWFWEGRIRIQAPDQRLGEHEGTAEIGCDGSNIFMLTPKGGQEKGRRFDQTAQVCSGVVPAFGGHAVFCWLTFAGCSVLDGSEEELRPYFQGYFATGPVPVKVAVQPATLFRRIDFLTKNPQEIFQWTNATFTVTELAWLKGRLIPKMATFQIYQWQQGRPRLSQRQTLTVTNVSHSVRVSFVPDIGGRNTLTVDRRFGAGSPLDDSAVMYVSAEWLPEGAVRRMPEFAQVGNRVGATAMTQERTRSRSRGFVFIICCILAAPVVLLVVRRKAKTW